MLCTKCGKTWVPGEATVCSSCSAPAGGAGVSSSSSSKVSVGGRMVPTGNIPALLGYYAAIASAIPYSAVPGVSWLVGPALGAVAVVLGILGLIRVRRHPEARGGAHAWFAIVGGIVLAYVGVSILDWVRGS